MAIGCVGDGVLDLAAEKELRVFHEELVKGIAAGDENDQRLASGATDAAGALPGVDDGSRVADEDTDVEPTNIDPQFEG